MIGRNPLPSEALGDFPSRRWGQLRRDVSDFLDSPWPAEAARLGWTDLDLFGIDAHRPYTRIDACGLLPLCSVAGKWPPGANVTHQERSDNRPAVPLSHTGGVAKFSSECGAGHISAP